MLVFRCSNNNKVVEEKEDADVLCHNVHRIIV